MNSYAVYFLRWPTWLTLIIICDTLLSYRGVGCIFVEMVTGIALFPGMRDTIDQLNKIWQVCVFI